MRAGALPAALSGLPRPSALWPESQGLGDQDSSRHATAKPQSPVLPRCVSSAAHGTPLHRRRAGARGGQHALPQPRQCCGPRTRSQRRGPSPQAGWQVRFPGAGLHPGFPAPELRAAFTLRTRRINCTQEPPEFRVGPMETQPWAGASPSCSPNPAPDCSELLHGRSRRKEGRSTERTIRAQASVR